MQCGLQDKGLELGNTAVGVAVEALGLNGEHRYLEAPDVCPRGTAQGRCHLSGDAAAVRAGDRAREKPRIQNLRVDADDPDAPPGNCPQLLGGGNPCHACSGRRQ